METLTMEKTMDTVAAEKNIQGELGKITILEAMATEPVSTDAISFDAMERSTPDGAGHDMGDS